MGKREDYIDKMAAQLKEWGAKIDMLKAKAEKEKAEVKIKLHEEVETLNQKKQNVHNKLLEIKESTEEAWGKLAEGVDKAWSDLKEAVHHAVEKFK